ncbi:MAG TPA: alpha/beta hydrolase [Candidatus Limnocylindrales bacterium]|nr:alpha/beta hydrolase [Candidatus Limnocylindrales bacterium]
MRRFLTSISWLLFVLLHPSAAESAAQMAGVPQGTYSGTLQAGEAKLHLLLHLSKEPNGSLRATLDSLEQGVFAIEASSVSFANFNLKLELTSVGARFEGKVSPDHEIIHGDWSQGNVSIPLSFRRETGAVARKPGDALFPVEGLWQGAVETHGMRLRFQLHISHDTEGELIAALDSLDQGVTGLPANKVTLQDQAFHFEIPSVAGVYEGTLNPTKNAIAGKWSQTSADNLPLDFKRSDQTLELRRPQTPARPFPYVEEEVTFHGGAEGIELSGTLTLPKGAGPFPAVLLVAGSGPEDRDASLANHRPFLLIADALTRKGIAVLRYDKRGVGKSAGNPDAATTMDLAADAKAALAFLKSRKEIDGSRVGLIGHSEGAIIAPYLAGHSKEVKWLVLLAAPATPGEQTLLRQSELIGRAGGLSDEQLEASLGFDQAAYALVRKEKDASALAEKLIALVKESGLDAALPPAALETQLRMLSSPWFRFFLDYDPLPNLKAVSCPVLALYGQKDLQVAPKANLPLLQKVLQDAANSHAEVRELPELNHLFQHAYTGTPAEYAAIEETFSPEALALIVDWVREHSFSK